jgi:hypothetical protein
MKHDFSFRQGALIAAALLALHATPALAQSTSILFIGNSFTYGDPAGA